jgi:hypothetical protein
MPPCSGLTADGTKRLVAVGGEKRRCDLVFREEVGPVPLAQFPFHLASRPRVVIDQQDWSTSHGLHLWAWLAGR